MPLFTSRLNRIADNEIATAGTLWLHTAAPSDGNPSNGRTNAGGGEYESGHTMSAGAWTAASGGDIENSAAIAFGTATAAVGTVTHWSFIDPQGDVAWGTLPSTVIASGDSFQINANSLDINGSTT